MQKAYLTVKRIADVLTALLGLILLSPFFLALIIAIKLDSRGPILFRQKRIVIHKTYFNILKFRTMRIDTPCDTLTHLLENPEQWITRVGRCLRRFSFDEFPPIFNILRGDMSIVGSRPALWNHAEQYHASWYPSQYNFLNFGALDESTYLAVVDYIIEVQ